LCSFATASLAASVTAANPGLVLSARRLCYNESATHARALASRELAAGPVVDDVPYDTPGGAAWKGNSHYSRFPAT